MIHYVLKLEGVFFTVSVLASLLQVGSQPSRACALGITGSSLGPVGVGQ